VLPNLPSPHWFQKLLCIPISTKHAN